MYMQNDIVAAASKGPHIAPPRVDPAVRQAEIDYILETANAALPKSIQKKLGRLSLAPASEDNDRNYFAQIRSEPIGAAGLEFRYPIPVRDTGEGGMDSHIANIVEAAVLTAGQASTLRRWTATMREMVLAIVDPASSGFAPMRFVAVGIKPVTSNGQMDITIDVEMLGCDLTTGIERVTAREVHHVKSELETLVETHFARRKTLAQAKVAGASGFVDEAALRIIDAARLDRAEILGLLRDRREVDFSFGGDEGYDVRGALFWVDGVISGYAERRNAGVLFRLDDKRLTIEATGLPATIIATLPGKRLREVVDIDIVPPNALILDVADSGDLLYFDLAIGRRGIEDEFPVAWPVEGAGDAERVQG